jgi:hypothetical protein
MGRDLFDLRTRTFAFATNRRGVLFGFTSGLLALLSLAFDGADVAGKRKKKKKKKKGQSPTSPPPAPPSSSPPPPSGPPVTTGDAQCPQAGSGATFFGRRVAQTFQALRSGQLTSAWIVLTDNPEGADLNFEIFAVNQATDLPTSPLCPPASLTEIPAFRNGSLVLTATFTIPATVVAGQRYALVVTSTSTTHKLGAHNNNPFVTGQVWRDDDLDGDYAQEPNRDLAFATFVTA